MAAVKYHNVSPRWRQVIGFCLVLIASVLGHFLARAHCLVEVGGIQNLFHVCRICETFKVVKVCLIRVQTNKQSVEPENVS